METAFLDVTVAVDGSEEARSGIDFAIGLGRKGARVHVCSVVDPALTYAASGGIGGPVDNGDTLMMLEEDARKSCAAAVALCKAQGVTADSDVLFGAVGYEIDKSVAAHHSQALIIGTHARTGMKRIFFGSVAERLMQASAVPVIVAHRDDVTGDGPIVVAVDDSSPARAALLAAIAEAQAQKKTLAILVAVDHGAENWLSAEPILDDAGDLARKAGLEFELVTLQGRAVDTIVECALRLRSPMIFIGTHGRADIARLVLGSVAAGVVEHAHVPVTVVRAPEKTGKR